MFCVFSYSFLLCMCIFIHVPFNRIRWAYEIGECSLLRGFDFQIAMSRVMCCQNYFLIFITEITYFGTEYVTTWCEKYDVLNAVLCAVCNYFGQINVQNIFFVNFFFFLPWEICRWCSEITVFFFKSQNYNCYCFFHSTEFSIFYETFQHLFSNLDLK